MWDLKEWTTLFFASLEASLTKFMIVFPNIFGAFIIILIGWLFARLLKAATRRILKGAKFDTLAERLNVKEMLEKGNINQPPSQIISKFVYWVIMLLVLMTTSDVLGWSAISDELSKLIGYLPTLFSAIVLFLVGAFIAGFIRDLIRSSTTSLGINGGRMISQIVFYLLFVIITLTALKQAGIDTTIITSNLLIIMAAILGTAAISYGFASRDILANILAGFFGKRMYQIGQEIEIDNTRGVITAISSIAITLKTEEGQIVIPSHDFIKKKVKIYLSKENDNEAL